MGNAFDFIKSLFVKFLDLVVVLLILFVGLVMIWTTGIFITNIANNLRMTGYLDYSVGVQFVLVFIALIWIPYMLIRAAGTRRRGNK